MCVCVYVFTILYFRPSFSVVNIVLVLIYFGKQLKIYDVECFQPIKKYLLLQKDYTVPFPANNWRDELPSHCSELFLSLYKEINVLCFYYIYAWLQSTDMKSSLSVQVRYSKETISKRDDPGIHR